MDEPRRRVDDVTVREYLESQLAERTRANEQRFDAHERALDLQTRQIDERIRKVEVEVIRLSADTSTIFARLDTLKTLLEERDKRHDGRLTEQKEALMTAFNAQKELTSALAKASETAIEKSEAAQAAYNSRSNEFRQALDDANKMNIPRLEADQRFDTLSKAIEAARAERVASLDRLGKELLTTKEAMSRDLAEVKSDVRANMQLEAGRNKGIGIAWVVVLGLLGAFGTLVGLIVAALALFNRGVVG